MRDELFITCIILGGAHDKGSDSPKFEIRLQLQGGFAKPGNEVLVL